MYVLQMGQKVLNQSRHNINQAPRKIDIIFIGFMSKTRINQGLYGSDNAQMSSPNDHPHQITITSDMFKKILQNHMRESIEMSIKAANPSASDKFRLGLDYMRTKPQGSANQENSPLLTKLEEISNLNQQFICNLQQVKGDQEKLFKENLQLKHQKMKLKSQLEMQKFLNQNRIQQQQQKRESAEMKYVKQCNQIEIVRQQLKQQERKKKYFENSLADQKSQNQKLQNQIKQAFHLKNKTQKQLKKMESQLSNTLKIISSKLSDTLREYNPNWKTNNNRVSEQQITQIIEALKAEMTQKSELSKAKEEDFKKMAITLQQSNRTLLNRLDQSKASQFGQQKPIEKFELAKNFISSLETQLKTNDENSQKISAEYIKTIRFFDQTINTIVKNCKSHTNSLQKDIYQKEEKINGNLKTIEGLQEQIKSLKFQLQQLKKNLSSNTIEIKQKENQIKDLKQIISEAERNLQVEMNKFKNLSSTLEKSQRQRNQVEEKLKSANIKIAQLTNMIKSLDKQIQQTNRKSTILNQDKDKQIKRLTSELNKQKTNLQNTRKEHKNEVQKFKQQFEDKSIKTRNSHSEEIKKLQDQLIARRQKISSLEKIYKESVQEIQSLRKKVSDLMESIQDIKKSASSFLCQSDILSPRIKSDQEHINFIKTTIQRYKGKAIIGSRTLARKAHRINYHSFIDNIPNIMVILKLINGRIVAGFSEHPFTEERFGGSKKGGGILMNVSLQKTYHLKGQETHKGIQYDKFFIIWGNSELRIKCLSKDFYSNFGIGQSNYNSEKDQVNDFLGGFNNQREIAPQHIQFVEILFEGIPSNKAQRQWYVEVV